MNLLDAKTGERLEGIIKKVGSSEWDQLKSNRQFDFDWALESDHEVWLIRTEEQEEMLGLMSMVDLPHEFRIHISLIESSRKQRGKDKTILNIPGCLIAHACRMAFQRGYDGFVSLVPKTKLISYYADQYGFVQIGRQMAVFGVASHALIKKYLSDEEI